MTSEQRLDRLERVAKLFVRAGLRERRDRCDLDEKINIIVNAQIANEDRFAKNEERFAKLAQSQTELAKAQTATEKRLDTLIEIVRQGRNGNPS